MLTTILLSTTLTLAALLVGIVLLDRRHLDDLLAEAAGERERARVLDLKLDAEARESFRLRMQLAELNAKLSAPVRVPVEKSDVVAVTLDEDAELERLFDSFEAREAAELPEVTDEEIEALFAEKA
jgi:hypothetical protein